MDAGASMKTGIPARYVGVLYGFVRATAGLDCQHAGGFCCAKSQPRPSPMHTWLHMGASLITQILNGFL